MFYNQYFVLCLDLNVLLKLIYSFIYLFPVFSLSLLFSHLSLGCHIELQGQRQWCVNYTGCILSVYTECGCVGLCVCLENSWTTLSFVKSPVGASCIHALFSHEFNCIMEPVYIKSLIVLASSHYGKPKYGILLIWWSYNWWQLANVDVNRDLYLYCSVALSMWGLWTSSRSQSGPVSSWIKSAPFTHVLLHAI